MSLERKKEDLSVSDEIEYYKKRKYKLDKTKDFMMIVCGVSIAMVVGSCEPNFDFQNKSYWYSFGSLLGSVTVSIYCEDEIKICDKKIKELCKNDS